MNRSPWWKEHADAFRAALSGFFLASFVLLLRIFVEGGQ